MFEKYRKGLPCDVIPFVIRNRGRMGRNPLKRGQIRGSAFHPIHWTAPVIVNAPVSF
jgi:hypothetical protein